VRRWGARLAQAAAAALLCLASLPSAAVPPGVAAALKAAGVPLSAAGLYVADASGRVLLEHNAATALNPASTMKLVTTAAALELLGPAATWRTEAHLLGRLSNGRLDGDLLLRGGGDPRLTLENLWLLLRDLRARGLRDIAGDLVIDRGAFAVADVDPAAFDGELTRPYNQGPDALLLNFRAVRLTFIPDAGARAVHILAEPPLPELGIANELALGDGPCDAWPERAEADLVTMTLRFRGSFALACGERVRHYSLLPPLDYARALFDHLWRGVGGSFSGRARLGATPPGSRPFAVFESPTLLEVVRDTNKNSNNVMARQLYLSLSARNGAPAAPEQSRAAVDAWLAARGLAMPEMVLENGAGLSRQERLSARGLGRLLAAFWNSPLGPELAASLPLAGVDGTLRRRFAGSPAAGRAHLKTGLLDQVRALAGYVHGEGGRTLVVVSLINHANASNAAPAQEALVEWALSQANAVPRGPRVP
jgi:D-alanyl-D-alanine carboxypeptidase/D-alanyl-D-alanine-endopeptidase (penicillin-binding protein 4)